MSALEQTTLDRRTARRHRVADPVPALIGRGSGLLVDLSERGVKIRHSSTVLRGATVRVSFLWGNQRFWANAEVLASRVVALGISEESPTLYETRLRFIAVPAESAPVLTRAIAELDGGDVRRWVANLHGWNDEEPAQPKAPKTQKAPHPAASQQKKSTVGTPGGAFMRCRLFGLRWEVKWTREREQPADGFLLPASTPDGEIMSLCDTYLRLDEEGRQAIRTMAAAAVEQDCSAGARLETLRSS